MTCARLSMVDRHFEGDPVAAEWWPHLAGCPECRQRFERRTQLAALLPGALSPEERMARALGIRPAPKPQRAWVPVLAGALTALVLTLGVLPRLHPESEARGAVSAGFTAHVYRVRVGEPPQPVARTLQANDELAFAVENVGQARWLLVFGVDEHRHVYWYHPSWTSPGDDPQAVALDATPGVRELPEAVRHALDGSRLMLHVVAAPRPMRVREVEALVTEPGAPLGISGALEQVLPLEVAP